MDRKIRQLVCIELLRNSDTDDPNKILFKKLKKDQWTRYFSQVKNSKKDKNRLDLRVKPKQKRSITIIHQLTIKIFAHIRSSSEWTNKNISKNKWNLSRNQFSNFTKITNLSWNASKIENKRKNTNIEQSNYWDKSCINLNL